MIKRSLIGLLSAAMIAGSLGGMPVTAYAAEDFGEEEIFAEEEFTGEELPEEVFTEEDIEEEDSFADEESLIDEDLVEETITEDFSEETENIEDIEAQPKEAAALAENSATSGTCGKNLTWELYHMVLTIKGTGPMDDYSDFKPAPWGGRRIDKIIIEEGVTSIGAYAFRLESLATVTAIPKSVTRFGEYCFYNVKAIDNCTLSDKTTYIGDFAFCLVDKLGTDITIPADVEYIGERAFWLLTTENGFYLKGFNKIEHIGEAAFYLRKGAVSVKNTGKKLHFPETFKYLGDMAFCNSGLTCDLALPNSLEYLGAQAFLNCSGVTGEIVIPKAVTSIGRHIFDGTSITKVTFHEKVRDIATGAFRNCTSIKELTFSGEMPGVITQRSTESFGGVKSGIVVNYDGSRRSWKRGLTGHMLGMRDAVPVFKPYYPDKECKVKFAVAVDGVKYDFPTQTVKCGGHATKPDASGIKLRKSDIPVWRYQYTKDGKDSWSFDLDFEKEIITEDITVALWLTWDQDESDDAGDWGDVPANIRSYMKFSSGKDIPKGIWMVGSDQYDGETFYADGKPKTLDGLMIFDRRWLLTEGEDYSLKYSDNVKAGEALITVTFKGAYFREKSKEYSFKIDGPIKQVSITKFSFAEKETGSKKLSPGIYTGSPVTKSFTLTDKTGKVLKGIDAESYEKLSDKQKRGYDYTYSYSKNVNKGKAKLVLCGVSGYKGKITKTFSIKALDISGENSGVTAKLQNKSYPLVKGGVKPQPVVTFKVGGKTETLTKGKDYTVSYKKNKKKGTATLKVTGKGNFKGAVSLDFIIE
ncbi:leucine-rich repeat domain-containing protein [Butyrivibrio sp. MC2021]|uniref:leucine-rich repeat domain-containing protein n=1 Tax=Butyrivibrio sp. MC2021 TaxID=1408306 RepID=UPI0006853242|nr:leucine-rich repeat domain-containing protein [Butyrivibrio sp. MC2021]